MSIYTKNKTTVSNLSTAEIDKENDVDKIVIESFGSKVDDVVKAFKDLEL